MRDSEVIILDGNIVKFWYHTRQWIITCDSEISW